MLNVNCFAWLLFGFLLSGWPGKEEYKRAPVVQAPESRDEEWKKLYDSLGLSEKGLSEKAFELSCKGFDRLECAKPYLAIADFTQSSGNRRLYVLDMEQKKLVMQTWVAHGRNSGWDCASSFSNREGSFQSSLGFYRTLGTYQGKHGLSLRLEGLEAGINDEAYRRAIVMHGADYVSEEFVRQNGRLGRSQGCPAVPVKDHQALIRLLSGGSALFIYSDSDGYLAESPLLSNLKS